MNYYYIMANISDFKGISSITWGFIVFFLISTIIPGILLLFLFREDLFWNIETLKLIMLSMGITMPVWVCNTFLVTISIEDDNKSNTDDSIKEDMQAEGLFGAIFSIPVLFLPALVKMFIDINSSVAFYIALGIELCIVLLFVVMSRRNKKKNGIKK